MKNASFRTVFILSAFMILFSCTKENAAGCSGAWATDLQNEITTLSTALSIYSMEENEANCNGLNEAYQDYIDALKPYGNCATLTGVNSTEWQNAINEAEADLDDIC